MNKIVESMPQEARPPKDIVCIECHHAHWHEAKNDGVECKCRLLSAITWNEERGKHGITKCTGSETLKIKENPNPCTSCQYAVWYIDTGEWQGYCRDIFRKIYGSDVNGKKVPEIESCNAYKKMEVL